jgi:hypothetical protein
MEIKMHILHETKSKLTRFPLIYTTKQQSFNKANSSDINK